MHLGVLPPAPHPSHSSPLSLHDALPISSSRHLFPHSIAELREKFHRKTRAISPKFYLLSQNFHSTIIKLRSEEHTSELQSRFDLVCRLLLEKKKARTAGEAPTG